jgi:copper chaperone CopZ
MATTTLSVPDISCAHCERTIKETLTPVDGGVGLVGDR